MDHDGKLDIVSGSYAGDITLYKGTEGGFETPKEVKQVTDISARDAFNKVLFTDVTFGDFNDDGLEDAFVGGLYGVRVMLNEGTKENPVLGERTPILRTDGEQVAVFEQADGKKRETASDFKAYIQFIDWDGDGVKDLITTSSYCYLNEAAILFHKGVKTPEGLRFEKSVPVLQETDGVKNLPGNILLPSLGDFNHDGKIDILLGVTMNYDMANNCFDEEKEYEFVIYGKDYKKQIEIMEAGRTFQNDAEALKAEVKLIEEKYVEPKNDKKLEPKYKTRGYILLFLGK